MDTSDASDGDRPRLWRRAFLGAGAGAVTALAGCTLAAGSVDPPTMPAERLESGGWIQTDSGSRQVYEESFPGVTLTARASTVSYRDRRLRREIREKTLGRVDRTAASLSASRVDYGGDLDEVPVAGSEVRKRTEAAARRAFERRLREQGLQDVERTGTGTLEVETGEAARLTTYRATVPVGDIDVAVTDDETVTVPGDPLPVAGDLAVWHHDGYGLVAGGAYPAGNVAKSVEEALSEAITVTVDVDLGLTPDAYREEVRSIVRRVR